MILIVFMKGSGCMNNLQGYNTNGYEYRASIIDRSNSRRQKWLNSEAEKRVAVREEQEKQNAKINSNTLLNQNKISNNDNNHLKDKGNLNNGSVNNTNAINNNKNNNQGYQPNMNNQFSRNNMFNPFNAKRP